MSWKGIFDSQGDIRPWGRDFWTDNFLGEVVWVIGGTALIAGAIVFGIYLLLTKI